MYYQYIFLSVIWHRDSSCSVNSNVISNCIPHNVQLNVWMIHWKQTVRYFLHSMSHSWTVDTLRSGILILEQIMKWKVDLLYVYFYLEYMLHKDNQTRFWRVLDCASLECSESVLHAGHIEPCVDSTLCKLGFGGRSLYLGNTKDIFFNYETLNIQPARNSETMLDEERKQWIQPTEFLQVCMSRQRMVDEPNWLAGPRPPPSTLPPIPVHLSPPPWASGLQRVLAIWLWVCRLMEHFILWALYNLPFQRFIAIISNKLQTVILPFVWSWN